MCKHSSLFRVEDGIYVWVNGQPVIFSVGYWIPRAECKVLWWGTNFYFLSLLIAMVLKSFPTHEKIFGCNFKKNILKRSKKTGDKPSFFHFCGAMCGINHHSVNNYCALNTFLYTRETWNKLVPQMDCLQQICLFKDPVGAWQKKTSTGAPQWHERSVLMILPWRRLLK